MKKGPEKKKLPRPCNRCGERFQPTGIRSKICDKCYKKSYEGRLKSYEKARKERTEEISIQE